MQTDGDNEMTRAIGIATATAMTLLGAMTAHAAAQQPDTRDKTIMTFSNAVELPGLTLEAGTYVFRLADTASRDVIQVLSEDENTTLGQWLFISAHRPEVSGDTVVTFRETSAGSTPAVQFWYYPGEKIGKEFIYPRDQAELIAARTGTGVRSDEGVVAGGGIAAVQTETTSAEASLENAPAAAQPSAAAGSLAGNRGVQAEADVNANANDSAVSAQASVDTGARSVGTSGQAESQIARNELPRTASPLALSGLLGLLSLAGAMGVRAIRK